MIETNDKKMKNKNLKFTKTLKKFFFNRLKTIFKNKKSAKKFITKRNKNINEFDIENQL